MYRLFSFSSPGGGNEIVVISDEDPEAIKAEYGHLDCGQVVETDADLIGFPCDRALKWQDF